MCCRSGACNLIDCDGTKDLSNAKCDEVTYFMYEVPESSTSVTIQLHDGKFIGNKDCSARGACCGGSGSSCAATGVCETTIDLSTCPGQPECEYDHDCDHLDHDCSEGLCQMGKCVEMKSAAGTVCREAEGVCDEPATCDGTLPTCPPNKKKIGFCCRQSAGFCDVPEYCDGIYSSCPEDEMEPEDMLCRASYGDCDEAEYCDGYSAHCPDDSKKSSSTLCRYAMTDYDGASCDVPEYCTGDSDDCPENRYEQQGVVCRHAADLCDFDEECDGLHASCPTDERKDEGYTFKCTSTQYLCGVQRYDLQSVYGGSYKLGTCNIGTGLTFIDLDYPECLNQCVNQLCPNGRSCSNIAEAHCNPGTGMWECVKLSVVSTTTQFPYCPNP
jgi:hypothetical protein